MFNFIINLFNKNPNSNTNAESTPILNLNTNPNQIFSTQYRNSYNKLWIKQLQNYYP